jgi:ABC-type phosphate/phosphonate transport system substrate-binding protein
MRWSARFTFVASALLTLVGAGGCGSAPLRLLSLIGVSKGPLVVALVAERRPAKDDSPLAALRLNPFAPYDQLQAVLRDGLGRPVGWDLCFPLQLESSLAIGLSHMAIISPADYAHLQNRERFPVIAVPVDEGPRVVHPAVLVVRADAAVKSVEELRGKIVAFGPAGDSRTHLAALELFARHGLKATDLSLELLPVPGSLKHMSNARAVAQTVMNFSSEAGFIDQADWEEFPEHAERRDDPARDRLKVIAETIALPDQLIVASPKLDAATLQKVREILLAADREHPEALAPLHVTAYQAPTAEMLKACALLAEPASPATQPAEAGGDAQ